MIEQVTNNDEGLGIVMLDEDADPMALQIATSAMIASIRRRMLRRESSVA